MQPWVATGCRVMPAPSVRAVVGTGLGPDLLTHFLFFPLPVLDTPRPGEQPGGQFMIAGDLPGLGCQHKHRCSPGPLALSP